MIDPDKKLKEEEQVMILELKLKTELFLEKLKKQVKDDKIDFKNA